jgi:hypothetical protein
MTSVLEEKIEGGCQWLTPVILATQEAEIRGIAFRSQPRHGSRDPISKGLVKEEIEYRHLQREDCVKTRREHSCL